MAVQIRWGILATGTIARKFAEGLRVLPDARLAAVGSRSQEKAKAFAEQYGAEKAYGSYEELIADKDVDVIYIATPHAFHAENAMACLNAGKAVLCEKSFAMNEKQAAQVVALARGKGFFLMEAMWTRFSPVTQKVREWIAAGRIGQVRMVRARFGFRTGWNEKGRLLNRALGGGALLDVGVYCVSYASMIYGRQPKDIAGLADIGRTGVDEQFGACFGYEAGQMAAVMGAVRTDLGCKAYVIGTEGSIRVPVFFDPPYAELSASGTTERFEHQKVGNGYNYEAAAVMDCLRRGKTECDIMPLDETLGVMRTMDRMRSQWGLRYDCDD